MTDPSDAARLMDIDYGDSSHLVALILDSAENPRIIIATRPK
jgi:hypothetical protein